MQPLSRMAAAAAATLSMTSLAMAAGIEAGRSDDVRPSFDILAADIVRDGRNLVFTMNVEGEAGADTPQPAGSLGGAPVWSYVWPTSFDPSVVGFEPKAGTLAFAVTSHPDFDDTPLFDEDGDGMPDNDGLKWHSHWVVLAPDQACGEGSLKVKDIPAGETPRLPKTWPNLPILIDSPGWHPTFDNGTLSVKVPFDPDTELKGINFDAVTAALRVNESVHAPLLCVTDVFEAAGGLSLPGAID